MSDHWTDYAKCFGMDTDIFFAEGTVFAKSFCSNCPVIEACREDAVKHYLKGVWGGTTESERETIRRKRRRPDLSKRGTHCAKGLHEFTPENTYLRPTGERQCRECTRIRRSAQAAIKPPKAPKPQPTHCRRNHEWRPETTYVDPTGRRICRLCRQETARDRREAARGFDRAAVA
jgi:hypothetical protein